MPDRVIPCPECNGESVSWGRGNGCICDNYGTIADRRKPTPNDRAVADVRALCKATIGVIDNDGNVKLFAERVLYRIESEASRG
jgi:hypothetical protein